MYESGRDHYCLICRDWASGGNLPAPILESLMKIRGIVLCALRLYITWPFQVWREVGRAFPCAKYPAFLSAGQSHSCVHTWAVERWFWYLLLRTAENLGCCHKIGLRSPRLKCVKWRGQRGLKATWNISGYHTGSNGKNVNWKQMPAFNIIHSRGKGPCGFRSLGLSVFIWSVLGSCWSGMCTCSREGGMAARGEWWILGSARGDGGLWIVVTMCSWQARKASQEVLLHSGVLRVPEMGQESSGRDIESLEILKFEQGR